MRLFYYIVIVLSLYGCAYPSNDDNAPAVHRPPFEKLDQKFFNEASSVLSKPENKIRLDSIIDIKFENYSPGETKPTKNVFYNYMDDVTYRITYVFDYNQNNHVNRISVYKGYIDDVKSKGTLLNQLDFTYDNHDNIVEVKKYYSDNSFVMSYFTYENNKMIKHESVYNSEVSYEQLSYVKDSVNIDYYNIHNKIISKSKLVLDEFKNITYSSFIVFNSQQVSEWHGGNVNYPKNIYKPMGGVFPENFTIGMAIFNNMGTEYSGMHLDKKEYQLSNSLQLNQFFYPEIFQVGDYFSGHKKLYYYTY
ncbi:hypothetical protein H1R17_03005 [Flavobacterium sp. xlx-214]|uniref:hypothetical protein n=1 Tax=unclassified Flavobacterium TaxID=196869 RepID=UPI0013D279E9|nr:MULTISPECIES: hypothetical protein [unclassified Flavobacterium]MBA5793319.1 hypothetical protein [Flavobacterium sp. xlx-221]QMI84117.1 hypothetical protein H1R17_03005 [Flavobacterium sp. xlx-214]